MSLSTKILNAIDILLTAMDKFNKMDFKASVVGKTKDGKYNVRFGSNTYLVPNASGRDYKVGDVVWIHKPNGSDTGQFIIASEYGKIGSSGGTTSGVSSVDGQIGDVVLTSKYAAKSSEHTHSNKSILDTITSVLVNKWNTAYLHATSVHARVDATLTEKSDVNGNIKINGIETKVYELPSTVASVTDVSTAKQEAIDTAYQNANGYTDTKIANLINGAPETLDTLKEVADAITESKTVEEALNNAIGTKASQAELDTHTSNSVIHIVASEREKWNNTTDKMGTTDISAVGSTATEAISNLNAKDAEIDNKINVLNNNLNIVKNKSVSVALSASNPYAYIYVSRSDGNIKDLGAADFLISIGSDLYWLHTIPNSYTSELSTNGLYAQIVTTQKDSTILSGFVMEADNRMRFKIKSEIGNSVLIINAMRNNVYIDSAKSNPS